MTIGFDPRKHDPRIPVKQEEEFKPFPTEMLKDKAINVAEGASQIIDKPEVNRAIKSLVKNKKDLEASTDKKLDSKTQKKVLSALDKPEELANVANNAQEGKEQSGPKNKWLEALAYFTPQLVGGAIGAIGGAISSDVSVAGGIAAGVEGATQLTDKVKAEKQAGIAAAEESRQKDLDRDLKRKMQNKQIKSTADLQRERLKSQMKLADKKSLAKLAELHAKGNPTTQQKLAGLSAEQQKRMGSVMTADRSLNEMVKSIEEGENLFELLGESKYTDARNRFVESIARLQSGAAISDKEFDIYTGFAPATKDLSREMVEEKMKRNRQFIDDQLRLANLSRQDLDLGVPLTLQNRDELEARRQELLAKRGQ